MNVAILLSTYNGKKFIHDFLESLCEQKYKNFTLLVRDDGSSDDTVGVIESFIDRLNIRIWKQDNVGVAASFLSLLDMAGGDFDVYMFADQDDWWNENKVLRCVRYFRECRRELPVMYCARLEIVNEELKPIKLSNIPRKICKYNALVENIATGCTIGLNTRARDILLSTRPRYVLMHDWWMYLVSSFFGYIFYDSEPVLLYRQHGGNTIGAAMTWTSEYRNRVRRFFASDKRTGIFHVSDQASEFLNCYGSSLDSKDREIVELLTGKQSFLRRLRLSISPYFFRQRAVDSMILRILFLLGRY